MKKLFFGLLLCFNMNVFGVKIPKKGNVFLPRIIVRSDKSPLAEKLSTSGYCSYAHYIELAGLTDHKLYHELYVREVLCYFAQVLDESKDEYNLEAIAADLRKNEIGMSDTSTLIDLTSRLKSMRDNLNTMCSKSDQLMMEQRERILLEAISKRRIRKD